MGSRAIVWYILGSELSMQKDVERDLRDFTGNKINRNRRAVAVSRWHRACSGSYPGTLLMQPVSP